jgi:hypothetical protein
MDLLASFAVTAGLFLAQSGHFSIEFQFPLLRAKRTLLLTGDEARRRRSSPLSGDFEK